MRGEPEQGRGLNISRYRVSHFLMFGPSFHLGNAAGIPIRIHWTFGLLILWAIGSYFIMSGSVSVAFAGLFFLLVIFGCVILHELGHSLTARYFGIETRSITLSSIGGVAALERSPRHWQAELWITIAGPAVNYVIAALTLPIVLVVAPFSPVVADPFTTLGNFLFMVFLANVILGTFNLIPAFPMDGGRILRALLAARGDRLTATEVATRVGKVAAVLMGLAGLFVSPLLVIVSIFVFFAGEAERRMVRREWEAARSPFRPFDDAIPFEPVSVRNFPTVTSRKSGEPVVIHPRIYPYSS